MKFDLHSHSTASDGKLSPSSVLALAIEAELSLFALTDHDNIDGFLAIKKAEASEQVSCPQIISGIEFSTTWLGVGVHIVGLDFDPEHKGLLTAIDQQGQRRFDRAQRINDKLAQKGFPNTLAGALTFCPDRRKVGRPHFAEYLYQQGHVKSMQSAFKRFLGNGKAGDVKSHWPDMAEAINWITEAGGVAVLAHPLKYKMTRAKLKRLIDAFAAAGGEAVEVTENCADPERAAALTGWVQALDLAGSGGSDFHSPDGGYAKIGRVGTLPPSIIPVWQRFRRTQTASRLD